MKLRSVIIFVLAITLGSCITIEDIPIVTVAPSVTMSTYISGGELNVTMALTPGTSVLVGGNVDLAYFYTGTAAIIDANTGESLETVAIDEEGAIQFITMSTDTSGVDEVVIVVAGDLEVYAKDKDDTYLTSSPFYGEEQIVYYREELPLLTVAPSVVINWNISGGAFHSTVTVYANPAISTLGSVPIKYLYQGKTSLTDMGTGIELVSERYENNYTSQYVKLSADTTGVDRMLITAFGNIDVYADVGNDGNPSNDVKISSGQFYDELEVVIND